MAKMHMRIIAEPEDGTREVLMAPRADSLVIKGTEGSISFVCGDCRDLLVKNRGPDVWIAYNYDEGTDEFTPTHRVRDIVFKCKGCGAFNEVV